MRSILFITRVDRTYFVLRLLAYIREMKEEINLVVLSDDKWNSCRIYVNDFVYMPSNVSQEEFLIEVIRKYNVKGIFVASGFDLVLLNNIKNWLLDYEIIYYTPDEESLKICLSKYEQYSFCSKNNILTPYIYNYKDMLFERRDDVFPLIRKPIHGQGSKGIEMITNREELEKTIHNEEFIIQEKIEGTEYTIDCFTDEKGELLLCVPRIRLSIVGSHSMVSKIQIDEKICELAMKINERLRIFGPWNFQLFKNAKGLIVHDINPRIASGIIFSMEAGAMFEKIIVDFLIKKKVINSGSLNSRVKNGIVLYCYNTCNNYQKSL